MLPTMTSYTMWGTHNTSKVPANTGETREHRTTGTTSRDVSTLIITRESPVSDSGLTRSRRTSSSVHPGLFGAIDNNTKCLVKRLYIASS